MCSLFLDTRATEKLTDAENDKFSRLRRCHANERDDASQIHRLGWIRFRITLDEKGFLLLIAHEPALDPLQAQKGTDVASDTAPQGRIIGLEDYPLCAFINRLFKKEEKATHVDITPLRVGRHRTCAPDDNASPGKGPNHINPLGIEHVM